MEKHVVDQQLTLVRTVPTDLKKEQLKIRRLGPKDENLTEEVLGPAMKNKSGAERARFRSIGSLTRLIGAKTTQLESKRTRLDRPRFAEGGSSSSGCGPQHGHRSGNKILSSEPIYIEAVKDVANDVKTSDTALFGKLLKILLDEVADQFVDAQ